MFHHQHLKKKTKQQASTERLKEEFLDELNEFDGDDDFVPPLPLLLPMFSIAATTTVQTTTNVTAHTQATQTSQTPAVSTQTSQNTITSVSHTTTVLAYGAGANPAITTAAGRQNYASATSGWNPVPPYWPPFSTSYPAHPSDCTWSYPPSITQPSFSSASRSAYFDFQSTKITRI